MHPATRITVILLVLIAVAHVARLALGVQATVGSAVVPMWVSIVGVLVPAGLAVGVWREHHSTPT